MSTLRRQHSTGTGRGVRRREFMQGAAALGTVATIGSLWFTGCSDGASSNRVAVPHQERAQHTLHFDLAEFSPDGIYVLHVIRSATPRVPLQRHVGNRAVLTGTIVAVDNPDLSGFVGLPAA